MTIQLYLGDCLEFMRSLPDGCVDAVVTDPPYNSNLKYASYQDNLPSDVYWNWLSNVISESKRIASGAVLVKHSSGKIAEWIQHFGKMRLLIWYKPFSSGFPLQGFATHYEPLWLVQGKAVSWSKDVIVCNAGAGNKEASFDHPAQMPEILAKQLISVCAAEGATILDPFMGSGTTGVACMQTGRNFIGCEIDPGYFEIAKRRIEQAQMQPALAEVAR